MTDTTTPATDASAETTTARRRAFTIFGVVLLVAAIGWAGYWLATRHYESTDDAYVAGDVLQVTSEIPGTIIAVHADDTQAVQRGDVLVRLT